ncbi:MAG TPA: metal-dependent hydrolase [Desulfotomaculum sp.]|nr:metal-dependent hydrolase [Desulfotomaculum sp.]
MLLLAHLGITFAAARGLEKAVVYRGFRKAPELIDYRLVLVGSMLPDIIDKPLGSLIFRESIGTGRIYCHTLLFFLLLLGLGMLFWYKLKRPGFLTLAGGSFAHYVLDGMWMLPSTFFWPAYGWGFPQENAEAWLEHWLKSLLTDPGVYVPEITGGLILIFFGMKNILRVIDRNKLS